MLKDNISNFLKGINLSIFAYGQTSTGKTFTMKGTNSSPGLIPLAIKEIFDRLNDDNNLKYTLKASYIEIYNETINDLLDSTKKNLEIRESLQKGIFIGNITEIPLTSVDKAIQLLQQGDNIKVIAETKLNEKSSRSHSIFRLNLELQKIVDGKQKTYFSQINLIDLAGSENVSKAKTDGLRMKEGANINKSLLALSNVIQKLSSNPKSFANFRDSKLTRLLQPALSGNSKTMIICTITDTLACYSETLNTLHFGTKAKTIKTTIKINELLDEKNKIISENTQLKSKIKHLEDLILEKKEQEPVVQKQENTTINNGLKNQNDMISALEKEVNMLKKILVDNEEVPEDSINNENKSTHSYNTMNVYHNLSANKYPPKMNMSSMLLSSGKKMTDSARKMYNRDSFCEPEFNSYQGNTSSVFKRCMSEMKTNNTMIRDNSYNAHNPHSMSNYQKSLMMSSNKFNQPNNLMSSAYKNQNYNNDLDLDFLCPSDFNGNNNPNNNNNAHNNDNYYFLLKENDDLRKNLYDVRKNFIDTVQNKENQIKSLNYNLNLTMENCEKLIREAEDNYINLKLNYDRTKEDYNNKDNEVKGYNQKIRTLEANSNYYQEEVNRLKSEILSINELKNSDKIYKDLEGRLSEVTKKYEVLYKQYESESLLMNDIKSLSDKLKNENSTLKMQLENYKSENMSYKTQSEVLKKNNDMLNNETSKLKNDIESYKNEIVNHKDKFNKIKSELNQLKISNEKQNQNNKDNKDNKICKTNIKDKKSPIDTNPKIGELEKITQDQASQILQLESQITDYKNNMMKIEQHQISEYQKLLDESFNTINELQTDLEKVNEKNTSLETKIRNIEEKKNTPLRLTNSIQGTVINTECSQRGNTNAHNKDISQFCVSEDVDMPLKEDNHRYENNDLLSSQGKDFIGKKRKYLPRVYQKIIDNNLTTNTNTNKQIEMTPKHIHQSNRKASMTMTNKGEKENIKDVYFNTYEIIMTARIKILYFAKLKEITKKGNDEVNLDKTSLTSNDIFELVKGLYKDKTTELESVFINCLISINDEYMDRDSTIQVKDNDEISILPPISAG